MTCPKCNAELSGELCPKCEPAASPQTPVAAATEPDEQKPTENAEPVALKKPDQEPDQKPAQKPDQKPEPKPSAGTQAPAPSAPAPAIDPSIKIRDGGEAGDSTPKPFTLKISETDLRDLVAVGGGVGNVAIGKLINGFVPQSASRPTLFDHLKELPPSDAARQSFEESELRAALHTLDRERLLLIVCSDRDLARAAGETLLTRVKATNRRVLSFNGLPADMTADVHGLTRRNARSELLILVDAYEGDRAELFVDSLFAGGIYGKLDICLGLSNARVRVACVTSEENLAGRAGRLEFGHWLVSASSILLREHFPEASASLEARIAEQRKAGSWSRSPAEFRKQIEELIRNRELEAVVEKGGPLVDAATDVAHEQGPIADPENRLALAVLYTATYYPNLAASEFARIVELIVGEQRTLVPETIQQKTKDGSFKTVQLQREKRIVEIWNERTDAVLRECRLITSRDVGRAIAFADVGRRDLLRRHFEEQYGAYVQRQFLLVWEKGLLFDKSSRIAADVILLTLEMATNDPDQFDREWLAERIVQFCEGATDPSFVLRRTSDVLRTLLRHPGLDILVNGVVERLLQLGKHSYAFAIVRALRLAPEFDDLYWLQQILDRGTDEIRGDVLSYLFNELRRADIGIHRYVATLDEKWLPAGDRDPDSYSPSNRAALLTLFAYCFEVTEGLDVQMYGAWPSRFPIFGTDRASATRQFSALLRCLLHPGLTAVLGEGWEPEELAREVAMLISKWVFILFGISSQPAGAEDDATDFTRDDALTVLVEQILAATRGADERVTRDWMVDAWEWAKELYLRAPSRLGEEGLRRRHEFGRKRHLLNNLITEFRRQHRAQPRTKSAQRATA